MLLWQTRQGASGGRGGDCGAACRRILHESSANRSLTFWLPSITRGSSDPGIWLSSLQLAVIHPFLTPQDLQTMEKPPSWYLTEDTEAFLEDHDTLECDMIKGLRELYLTGALCDAAIITENRRFPCHRVVLAVVSPYFRAMFTSSMQESKHGEVSLLDVPSSVIETILHFIYGGEVALTLDNVEELFTVSSRLQITALQNLCSRFLINKLTSDNCFRFYRLAHSHNPIRFKKAVIQYITWNITNLTENKDLLQLDQDELITILSSDQLMVSSELCIYHMALRWWKANGASDSPFPVGLSKVIRFPLMSADELEEVSRDGIPELSGLQTLEPFKLRQGMFETKIVCMDLQVRKDPTLGDRDFLLDCYDPASDKWDTLPPLKTLRYPGCLAVENYLYVTGGMNQDNSVSRTFHVYDSLTNRWTELPSMTSPRSLLGFLSYKKSLFAVGGWKGDDALDSMECFDIDKNCWSELSKLSFSLCAFASTQLKGKLYLIGGQTGQDRVHSKMGLIYDINSDLWSHIPNQIVVAFGGAVTFDRKVVVIGGYDNSFPSMRKATARCLCLDEQGFVCKTLKVPPLPKRMASAGVVRWKQRIYVLGGENEDWFYKSMYYWTPGHSRWTQCTQGLPILHEGVSGFGCVALWVPMRKFWHLIPHRTSFIFA